MKMPTTITKKASKKGESTFFKIAYNGKELGTIGIFNVFTSGGALGMRISWTEIGEGFDADKPYVFDFTDRDEQGNIRYTK